MNVNHMNIITNSLLLTKCAANVLNDVHEITTRHADPDDEDDDSSTQTIYPITCDQEKVEAKWIIEYSKAQDLPYLALLQMAKSEGLDQFELTNPNVIGPVFLQLTHTWHALMTEEGEVESADENYCKATTLFVSKLIQSHCDEGGSRWGSLGVTESQ